MSSSWVQRVTISGAARCPWWANCGTAGTMEALDLRRGSKDLGAENNQVMRLWFGFALDSAAPAGTDRIGLKVWRRNAAP